MILGRIDSCDSARVGVGVGDRRDRGSMGAGNHSPSSAKTSPRGSGVGGGGEQYSPSTKSPRAGAGGGGGGEHYSASSKSPQIGRAHV